MTRRLYHDDARRFEADATLTRVEPCEGGAWLMLDATVFYPTSGGQPCDLGLIANARVVDVIERGEEIAHRVEGELPGPGAHVRLRVDAARRRDHMVQHTGQHLLSAIAADRLGAPTVGFHLGQDLCTVDLDTPTLGAAALADLEIAVDATLRADHVVTASFPSAEALKSLPLRKDETADLVGPLRVVSIGEPGVNGIDVSLCCGTHVARTGEIGAVALCGTEKVRNGTRLSFVCGERATRLRMADRATIRALGQALSAGRTEIEGRVAALCGELKTLRRTCRRQAERLAIADAAEHIARAPRSAAGVPVVGLCLGADESELAEPLYTALVAEGAVALVGYVDASGRARVMFGRGPGAGPNLGAELRALVEPLGGKGGGRPECAQGGAPSVVGLAEAIRAVADRLAV